MTAMHLLCEQGVLLSEPKALQYIDAQTIYTHKELSSPVSSPVDSYAIPTVRTIMRTSTSAADVNGPSCQRCHKMLTCVHPYKYYQLHNSCFTYLSIPLNVLCSALRNFLNKSS